MVQKNLSVYINDHLAGAAAALRLCDRLRRRSRDATVAERVADLREAIARDEQRLQEIRRTLGIEPSRVRSLAAIGAQKLSNLKLRLEGSDDGDLQLLHALDALSLGVEGKKALWTALEVGAQHNARLRLADYGDLIRRADDQLARLRDLRAEAAQRAFKPDGR